MYISVNLFLLVFRVNCSQIFFLFMHAIMIFKSYASYVGNTVTKALAGMLEAKQ